MRCAACAHWITRRVTVYGDGSHIETFKTPDGKGLCDQLNIETSEAFGCTAFLHGGVGGTHIISTKDGAPWENWHYDRCPDCSGDAAKPEGGMCIRCAGIGKVRHYDDGFIGNEQDQMHPEEKKRRAPPTCPKCSQRIELNWKACPHCGIKLEPPSPPEVVKFDLRVA